MADRIPIPDLPELGASPPFRTNSEAFGAGLDLLRDLRDHRLGLHAPVGNEEADTLIAEYCRRLRNSDLSITLSAVQRQERIIDDQMVLILAAVRNHFAGSSVGYIDIRAAVTLAAGLDPARQRRLVQVAQRTNAVHWDEQFHLWPSKPLVDFLCGTKIEEKEACWLKAQVQRLPTADKNRRQTTNGQNPEPL